jgi:hypothetical protein
LQPDTIVQSLHNPQSLNRYSYVRNNPIRYNDPTGHWVFETNDPDSEIRARAHANAAMRSKKKPELVIFEDYTGSWSSFPNTTSAIEEEAFQFGRKLAMTLNGIQRNLKRMGDLDGNSHYFSPGAAFLWVFNGPIVFRLLVNAESYAAQANSLGGIDVYKPRWIADHANIVHHELFHQLEHIVGIDSVILPQTLKRKNGDYGTPETRYNGFYGGKWDWQFSLPDQLNRDYETLADMGLGWVKNRWGASNLGTERKNYVEVLMTNSLTRFIP